MTINWGMIGADLEACRAAWAIREYGQGRIAAIWADPAGWGRALLALTAARPTESPEKVLSHPSVTTVIISGSLENSASLAADAVACGKTAILTLPLRIEPDEAALLDAQTDPAGHRVCALVPSAFVAEWAHLKASLAAGTLGQIGTFRLGRLEEALGTGAPENLQTDVEALMADLIAAAEACAGPLLRLRVTPACPAPGREYLLAAGKFESGALVHLEAGLTEPARSQYFYFEVACAGGLTEFDSRIEREYVYCADGDTSPLQSAYARLADAYAEALHAAATGAAPAGLLAAAARASALARPTIEGASQRPAE